MNKLLDDHNALQDGIRQYLDTCDRPTVTTKYFTQLLCGVTTPIQPSAPVDEKVDFEKAMQEKFGWNNTLQILYSPEMYSEAVYACAFYAFEGWQARAKLNGAGNGN